MGQWERVAWAALISLSWCGPAAASDYLNNCTTADPRFEINDEVLSAKSDPGQVAIPFEILDKQTTSERRGYCVAQGNKYGFEASNSTLRIRFTFDGSTLETTATCEMASDGLPAGYNCEREVVTFETGKAGGGAIEGSVWNHNGSVMRLQSDGAVRRFVYDEPRPGMVNAGAQEGDVVFEGERQGMTYTGTAYIFSKNCGRVPYPVTGNVTDDQQGVVLHGQVPRLDNDCSIKSYRPDRLSFEYVRAE